MKFIKKYKNYILAFLIPFIFYFLFFLWKGMFTDKTILSSDMLVQYNPIFQYLQDVLRGNASFPYTFSKGIGGGMYGALFYDFANPFNFLVYFFDNVPLFLTVLILFKLAFTGLTMYIFLNHKFKDNKYLLIFALAYALMGYNVTYYVNFMWLDGVILVPIVLLGIDRLLEKKKSRLYIVSIFATIFLNYYIGYMVVIFSCIYFMYSFLLKNSHIGKQEVKQIIHFFLVTLLTGLATSFILIPVGIELLHMSRVVQFNEHKWLNYNFLDLMATANIGYGSLENPLNYKGFLIFVGTVMFPLIICYFCNKQISKREKILTSIVYAFFLLPIVCPQLNRLWHMSTLPMAFNYRYSFLASLFTIMIMMKSLEKLEISKKKPLFVFYAVYIILSVSLIVTNAKVPEYYMYLTIPKIVVTVILIGINIFLLLKKKIKYILCLLILELIGNAIWIGLDSEMNLKKDYYEAREKVGEITDYCPENKRCETTFGYSLNDSLFANYHGVSVFLTSQNGKVLKFLGFLDNNSKSVNFYNYHIDYVFDTLFGVEIVESKYPIEGYEILKEYTYQDVDLYLLKNPSALSLGYLVSPMIKDYKIENYGIFLVEDILNSMSEEVKQYFYKLPLEKVNDQEYRITKDKKYSNLYVFCSKLFEINHEEVETFLVAHDNFLVLYDEYGDELTFTFDDPVETFEVYVLDIEKVKEFKESRMELVIDKNTGNKIESHIEVKEASTLFTTIPYEKGWKVLVDGKEVEAYEVLDTFLAIDIEEGYHTITFEYHVYGLKLGIFISVLSFLFLLGYEYKYKNSITRSE